MGNAGRHFPWKRFWIPRDTTPELVNGYLADPETHNYWRLRYNAAAKTLPGLEDIPCLVLVGEPGIGKSRVISEYHQALLTTNGPARVRIVDFRWTHDTLDKLVFSTPTFESFVRGSHDFTLILDSLDEHPLGAPEMAGQLLHALKNLAPNCVRRLRLRIGCRMIEWPASVDKELEHLWKEGTHFYALAPLREADIRLAAGSKAQEFLAAVERVHAGPFAAKPVTLLFLLEEFDQNGRLPERQADIYEAGCLRLCEDSSESRVERDNIGKLRPEQRIAIASRIAAASILSRRNLIESRKSRRASTNDVIALDDLRGGLESSTVGDVEVTSETLEDTLFHTNLFRRADNGRIGWDHQTFAEFLAARFLVRRGLSAPQILDELSNAEMRCPVPALRVTIAWTASMSADMLQHLLRHAPEVLLSSDLGVMSDKFRNDLVHALLEKIDRQEMRAEELVWDRKTQVRLKTDTTGDLLRPFIVERNRSEKARYAAIEMARTCNITTLQESLAELALCEDEPYGLRITAGKTVAKIGARTTKRRLRRLLEQPSPVDNLDSLKGVALDALWPDDLTPAELFSHLSPPANETHSNEYLTFLSKLRKNLTPDAIVEGLRWSQTQPGRYGRNTSNQLSLLVYDILEEGWKSIHDPLIRREFALGTRTRLEKGDHLFRHLPNDGDKPLPKLEGDDRRRKLLILELFELPPWSNYGSHGMQFVHAGVILPVDVPWVMAKLETSPAPQTQQRWADVLRAFLGDPTHSRELTPVIDEACARSEALQLAVFGLSRVGGNRSPYMRWKRRAERALKKEVGRHRMRWQLPPHQACERVKSARGIRSCMKRFEQGDFDAGWELQKWLAYDRTTRQFLDEEEWNIRKFPGWLSADEPTKERILVIAKDYLQGTNERAHEWLEQGCVHRAAAGGYRYLCLLYELERSWLDAHGSMLWRNWASIAIMFDVSGDGTVASLLAVQAYKHNPAQVLRAVDVSLKAKLWELDVPHVVYRMALCRDKRFLQFVLDFTQGTDVGPNRFKTLLNWLLKEAFEPAIQFAKSIVGDGLDDDAVGRERQTAAMITLLANVPELIWNAINPILEANPRFGLDLFLNLPYSHGDPFHTNWGPSLQVEQMESVIHWLERYVDRAAIDENAQQFRIDGPRMLVGLQGSLIQRLTRHGDRESLHALQRLQAAFPKRDWADLVLMAKESVAQKTWTPRTPQQIIALRPPPSTEKATPAEILAPTVLPVLSSPRAMTPRSSPLWLELALELALDCVGDDVRISARGSQGQNVSPRSLGVSREALDAFSKRVERAAAHGQRLPNEVITQAQAIQKAVLAEEIGTVLTRMREASGGALLVRFMVPRELQAVPWEALCNHGEALGFFGTAPDVLPVRGVASTEAWTPREVRDAVKVLAVAPTGGEEGLVNLRLALQERIANGEIEWIDPIEGAAASKRTMFDQLRDRPIPHVLHFLGHGGFENGLPALRMADDDGEEQWLPVELLAQQLKANFSESLRLIVLEACEGAKPSAFASAAESLAKAKADAVVAHLWPVRADVAQTCSTNFYRALTSANQYVAGDVAFAANEARRAILSTHDSSAEAMSPVLYLRAPTGRLFDFAGRCTQPVAAANPLPNPTIAKPLENKKPNPGNEAIATRANTTLPLDLIDFLADSYPDVGHARMLWVRAGGKVGDIENISRARDLWQHIWTQSVNGARVQPISILKAAQADFPHNPVLARYISLME